MDETLDHTADVRLLSTASSLQGLFERCLVDLDRYIFGEATDAGEESRDRSVTVGAADRESLLVDWLSEALFIMHVEYVRCVKVRIHEFGEFSLVATLTMKRARALHDVKAVTYSELEIGRHEGEWRVVVTYDI